MLNLALGENWRMTQLRVLRVPDVREGAAMFARGCLGLQDLIDACAACPRPALRAWQHEFLDELQHAQLPLATLARRAGVSAAHASRSFLKSHGMSPQLLRRELRLRQALSLLAGDAPMAEVAASSGFSDQSHLNRTLHLATGGTPARLAETRLPCDPGHRSASIHWLSP